MERDGGFLFVAPLEVMQDGIREGMDRLYFSLILHYHWREHITGALV